MRQQKHRVRFEHLHIVYIKNYIDKILGIQKSVHGYAAVAARAIAVHLHFYLFIQFVQFNDQ